MRLRFRGWDNLFFQIVVNLLLVILLFIIIIPIWRVLMMSLTPLRIDDNGTYGLWIAPGQWSFEAYKQLLDHPAFLRDLAQPVLDLDSHAKVQMRAKVRGLRAIEREVLQARMPQSAVSASVAERSASSAVAEPALPLVLAEPVDSAAVSQRVPAGPILERAGASAASSPAQPLVVAESPALPVVAEEDPSPPVSQTVPAAPILERGGASAASRPAQSPVVAESLAVPVLAEQDSSPAVPQSVPAAPVLERAGASVTVSERPDAGEVVLDYCTAVRGILNDDQGGPLHPCGVRMAAALGEVRQSLERSLAAKKGGAHTSNYDG